MNRVILVVIYILVVALCLTFEIMGSPCKHENTHTDTVASNCTKGGTSTVICDDCGEILSTRTLAKNDKHTIVAGRCSLCGAEKCEKTGGNHTFKVYRSTPGTCKDRGYEWKKCSGCGYDKVAETVFGDHMGLEKKVVSVRLDEEFIQKLKELAEQQNRSLSNLVETVLKDYVSKQEKQ